jgi:hypothetical protein
MKKKILTILFLMTMVSCGPTKPSWERKECCKEAKVTQTDHAIMGILLSGLILFSLHTFTNAR